MEFANGDSRKLEEIVKFKLTENTSGFKFSISAFIIETSSFDLILGNKFLSQNSAIIDYEKNIMIIANYYIPLRNSGKDDEIDRELIKNICYYSSELSNENNNFLIKLQNNQKTGRLLNCSFPIMLKQNRIIQLREYPCL